MRMAMLCVLLVLSFALLTSGLNVGTGIYDITGPAAELGMMGYAAPKQITSGIQMRLRARSFIFQDPEAETFLVVVNVDLCMFFTEIKTEVLERVCKSVMKDGTYSECPYTQDNVMITAIHTHSGPAGYTYFPLYNINSYGYQAQNFEAIANGVSYSIIRAHNNLTTSNKIKLSMTQDKLEESNISRSPTSYLSNPLKERESYPDGNTDKDITLVKIQEDGSDLGFLSWFSVHGTAFNNTNTLISSDNKGYAAYLFEKKMNNALPGTPGFVAGFLQTNEGDVSPNTAGPSCPDGSPCDSLHSTCNGKSQGCIGKGPGKTDKDSCRIIGNNQFEKALEMFNSPDLADLSGELDFVHTFLDMSAQTVNASFATTGKTETTCSGALGSSFAAGTTDGPGEFNFVQHSNNTSDNPFWRFIGKFLHAPSKEQIACQSPKPILLDTQATTVPIQWTANIIPLQIFRIGYLFIIAVPGEFTTMSGRRLRKTVYDAVLPMFKGTGQEPVVVISGLANAYTHYITTYEEYQDQRYEGASTLFGPHTLAAYQQNYYLLANALATKDKSVVPESQTLPDYSKGAISFQPGVIEDTVPLGTSFGDVHTNPSHYYNPGQAVKAVFWGADPRNDLRIEDTFLTVERQLSTDSDWTVIRTDGDWDTNFSWKRHGVSESLVTVSWFIDSDFVSKSGYIYRVCCHGNHRNLLGHITEYSGCSSEFTITAPQTSSMIR